MGAMNGKAWRELALDGGGRVWGYSYTKKECYIRCLELDPECASAWHNLGVQCGGRLAGRECSSKECYSCSLVCDPEVARGGPKVWRDIQGRGRVAGKDYTPKECYVRSLELDPKCALAWNSLGVEGGGRIGTANYTTKQCFAKSIDLNLRNARAWNNLGTEGGGQVTVADGPRTFSQKECYIRALELDPTLDSAMKNLNMLVDREQPDDLRNVDQFHGHDFQGNCVPMREAGYNSQHVHTQGNSGRAMEGRDALSQSNSGRLPGSRDTFGQSNLATTHLRYDALAESNSATTYLTRDQLGQSNPRNMFGGRDTLSHIKSDSGVAQGNSSNFHGVRDTLAHGTSGQGTFANSHVSRDTLAQGNSGKVFGSRNDHDDMVGLSRNNLAQQSKSMPGLKQSNNTFGAGTSPNILSKIDEQPRTQDHANSAWEDRRQRRSAERANRQIS